MLNANNIQLSIRFGYTYELLRPLVQELLQSVVASDRSRAADMPTKWGDTFYPDYHFVYNLAFLNIDHDFREVCELFDLLD